MGRRKKIIEAVAKELGCEVRHVVQRASWLVSGKKNYADLADRRGVMLNSISDALGGGFTPAHCVDRIKMLLGEVVEAGERALELQQIGLLLGCPWDNKASILARVTMLLAATGINRQTIKAQQDLLYAVAQSLGTTADRASLLDKLDRLKAEAAGAREDAELLVASERDITNSVILRLRAEKAEFQDFLRFLAEILGVEPYYKTILKGVRDALEGKEKSDG